MCSSLSIRDTIAFVTCPGITHSSLSSSLSRIFSGCSSQMGGRTTPGAMGVTRMLYPFARTACAKYRQIPRSMLVSGSDSAIGKGSAEPARSGTGDQCRLAFQRCHSRIAPGCKRLVVISTSVLCNGLKEDRLGVLHYVTTRQEVALHKRIPSLLLKILWN